jgi:hypothetical protein
VCSRIDLNFAKDGKREFSEAGLFSRLSVCISIFHLSFFSVACFVGIAKGYYEEGDKIKQRLKKLDLWSAFLSPTPASLKSAKAYSQINVKEIRPNDFLAYAKAVQKALSADVPETLG